MAKYAEISGLENAQSWMLSFPNENAQFHAKLESKMTPRRRKQKNYHWTLKGTKQSRRQARSKSSAKPISSTSEHSAAAVSSHSTIPISATVEHATVPISATTEHSSTAASSFSAYSDTRPTCQIKECKNRVGKRKYGSGYFYYCYHHRHLSRSNQLQLTNI